MTTNDEDVAMPRSDSGRTRVRWAAIGAAVAVTLGAGGLGLVGAADGDGRDGFVPITPCRLADTRPAPANVGSRSTPIGPGETAPFAVHGVNGDCDIPSTATGVMANVTAVSPTSDTFVTLFPADVERPNSSNLNLVAGAPATPNQVTVRLPVTGPSMGVVNVFNERGEVDVVVDLVGYFTAHDHDDRYYTEPEVDGLAANAMIGAGAVAADGSDVAGRPRFGDWSVTNTGPGAYTISFPGATDDCGGDIDTPLIVAGVIGVATGIATPYTSSCSAATGDVHVNVRTLDFNEAQTNRAFSFVAYLPGPGQVTP